MANACVSNAPQVLSNECKSQLRLPLDWVLGAGADKHLLCRSALPSNTPTHPILLLVPHRMLQTCCSQVSCQCALFLAATPSPPTFSPPSSSILFLVLFPRRMCRTCCTPGSCHWPPFLAAMPSPPTFSPRSSSNPFVSLFSDLWSENKKTNACRMCKTCCSQVSCHCPPSLPPRVPFQHPHQPHPTLLPFPHRMCRTCCSPGSCHCPPL